MLSEFKDMGSGRLGKIDATKHRIELKPGARPIYQAPYRAGPIACEKEKKETDGMLHAGVIEPTSAEWASPVVFVPKKDGTMRFCVDYRKLNAVTVSDSYPLPRMDECIDSLGDATVFTTQTVIAGIGRWRSPRRIAIKLRSRRMLASTAFYVCFSVSKTRPRYFNEW